jgi:hypothetical protein
VAEALALGKFVIASDRGSIPEVGGDLVEYVDPWNASAWADAIQKYFADPKLVESRAARIRKEYHPIHWDEAATTVLELVDHVQTEPKRRFEFEPGYDMKTFVGVCYGPKVISNGKAGVLCYGPYQPLPPGPVRVTVDLESNGDSAGDLHFKFGADKGLAVFRTEKKRIAAGRRSYSFTFDLTIDHGVDDFEVVIDCEDGVTVAVNKLEIQLQ